MGPSQMFDLLLSSKRLRPVLGQHLRVPLVAQNKKRTVGEPGGGAPDLALTQPRLEAITKIAFTSGLRDDLTLEPVPSPQR